MLIHGAVGCSYSPLSFLHLMEHQKLSFKFTIRYERFVKIRYNRLDFPGLIRKVYVSEEGKKPHAVGCIDTFVSLCKTLINEINGLTHILYCEADVYPLDQIESKIKECYNSIGTDNAVLDFFIALHQGIHHTNKGNLKMNQWNEYNIGITKVGAQMMLIPVGVAKSLVDFFNEYRYSNPHMIPLDNAIPHFCKENSIRYFIHIPSLTDHLNLREKKRHYQGFTSTYIKKFSNKIKSLKNK
jgi:hypothetical protein